MSLNNKGFESGIRVPFDFLGGVFQSLMDILVEFVMLPITMICALFDFSTP